jgi:hypothetical protein
MTLDTQYNNGGQSLYYSEIRNYGFAKIRVRIRRDSYDAQSHATAEIWTSVGWQEAVAWPMTPDRACAAANPYSKDWRTSFKLFALDAERLFEISAKIAA